jgi:hypothetical protein
MNDKILEQITKEIAKDRKSSKFLKLLRKDILRTLAKRG